MADVDLRGQARALGASPGDLEAFLRHRRALRRSGWLDLPAETALADLLAAVAHRERAWLYYQSALRRYGRLGESVPTHWKNRAQARRLASGIAVRRAFRWWLYAADLRGAWEAFVREFLAARGITGSIAQVGEADRLWPKGIDARSMRDILDDRLRVVARRRSLWV